MSCKFVIRGDDSTGEDVHNITTQLVAEMYYVHKIMSNEYIFLLNCLVVSFSDENGAVNLETIPNIA